ncbi:MAG: hypothetical protein J0H34_23765 [Rhizobiales bacterium]|nr:hypothetical protein [Hyphomicrobiales bacterium]
MTDEPTGRRKPGPKPKGEATMTGAERQRRYRLRQKVVKTADTYKASTVFSYLELRELRIQVSLFRGHVMSFQKEVVALSRAFEAGDIERVEKGLAEMRFYAETMFPSDLRFFQSVTEKP